MLRWLIIFTRSINSSVSLTGYETHGAYDRFYGIEVDKNPHEAC